MIYYDNDNKYLTASELKSKIDHNLGFWGYDYMRANIAEIKATLMILCDRVEELTVEINRMKFGEEE